MKEYDIVSWQKTFEKMGWEVDEKTDLLESNNVVLFPGRFYVLNYMVKTRDAYNARPVIISLGNSVKDPESFLCIDLSVMPKKIRIKFVEMFYDIFKKIIVKNIEEHPFVDDADNQDYIRECTYENLVKAFSSLIPFRNAVKRYKIKDTRKIFSVPFNNVYKLIGDYCDENFYVNGNIIQEQKRFLDKMRK